MFSKIKKAAVFFVIAVFVFTAGFFARGLFDRRGVSGTAEYYQNIQDELRRADEAYSGIEGNIDGARDGIAAGIVFSGTIGNGLDGAANLTAENTELLGRAERILLDAGARESFFKE